MIKTHNYLHETNEAYVGLVDQLDQYKSMIKTHKLFTWNKLRICGPCWSTWLSQSPVMSWLRLIPFRDNICLFVFFQALQFWAWGWRPVKCLLAPPVLLSLSREPCATFLPLHRSDQIPSSNPQPHLKRCCLQSSVGLGKSHLSLPLDVTQLATTS